MNGTVEAVALGAVHLCETKGLYVRKGRLQGALRSEIAG